MHMLLFLVSTPINNRLFNMVIQITLVFSLIVSLLSNCGVPRETLHLPHVKLRNDPNRQ